MRRPTLAVVLIAGNAGLVLVAVVLISWEASGMLRALSDERGLGQAREVASAVAASVAGTAASGGAAVDDALTRAMHDYPQTRVTIVTADTRLTGSQDRDGLRARAIASGEPAAAHLGSPESYVAVVPVHRGDTAAIAFVEAVVPASPLEAALRTRLRILWGLTLAAFTLLIAGSAVLARGIARPLASLSEAAVRFGREDFATPVPPASIAELGTLTEAMEEMRTRLSRTTADLRRLHTGAEAVLAGIVEGVFAVDRERRIRYLNPQTAAMLGLDARASIGRFCGDVLRPEEADGGRPCEERCPIVHARFLGSARATEILRAADGARRAVVITSSAPAAAEPGAAPERDRQFQVMRDETELEATRRLRDTILANISHEFRTPLAAQLAALELLRDRMGHLSPDETRTLLLSLERGTMRLTQLIDNLLESVRIESGRIHIRRRPLALDEVVEEAVELTGHLHAQRRQEIVVDLPYPLPPVEGDAPRLVQVFVNLLANAHKFAPEGSTIGIGGAVADDEVTLWVEDQGPGLPPGRGADLFRRFYRAPGEEPSESGFGLGLWIVKSIVERHQGRVEARRAASGTGTRMCVILPVAAGRSSAEAPRKGAEHS